MKVALSALAKTIDFNFFDSLGWLGAGYSGDPRSIDVTDSAYGSVPSVTTRVVSRALVRELGPCVIVDPDAMRQTMWDAIPEHKDELAQLVELLNSTINNEVTLHKYGARSATDTAGVRKTTTSADAVTDTRTRGARTDTATGSETYTYPPTSAGLVEPAQRTVTESGQQIDTDAAGARKTTVDEDAHTDTHGEIAHTDETERVITPTERARLIHDYTEGVYSILRNILLLAVEEGRDNAFGI